ncbi:MAG: hypothetical protein M3347_07730, partial [Armatimonadota bacterium]|nr:hypothetical protein [Armatimonadota bacterium]
KKLPRTAASAGRSGVYGLLVTSILLVGLALKSQAPQVTHAPVDSHTPYPSAAPSAGASGGVSGDASRNGSGTYYQDIMERMNGMAPSYRSVSFASRPTRRSRARRRILNCTPTRCTPTRRASHRRASSRRACTRCTPVRKRA